MCSSSCKYDCSSLLLHLSTFYGPFHPLCAFRCALFRSLSIASLSHSFYFLSFSFAPFYRYSFSISIVCVTEILFSNNTKMLTLNETLVKTALRLEQIRKKTNESFLFHFFSSSFFSIEIFFPVLFELSLFNEQCSKQPTEKKLFFCMPFQKQNQLHSRVGMNLQSMFMWFTAVFLCGSIT